jgi:hypothetical protein
MTIKKMMPANSRLGQDKRVILTWISATIKGQATEEPPIKAIYQNVEDVGVALIGIVGLL